jgi:hypothetical protein
MKLQQKRLTAALSQQPQVCGGGGIWRKSRKGAKAAAK